MSKIIVAVVSVCCALTACSRAPAQKEAAVARARQEGSSGSVGDNQIIGLDLMSLRDGHGGPQYFPIDGSPVVGQRHLVDLQIHKGASQVSLELHNEQGELLKTLPMEQTRSDEPPGNVTHWGALLEFPAEPVRLVVVGDGSDGKPFRMPARGYAAKSIELELAYFPSMIGGRPYEYEVKLKNYGPDDHFQLTIEDDANFLPATLKQDIALKSKESTTIKVMLKLPVLEEGQFLDDHLYASVVSTSRPENRVDASAALSLLPGRDSDADMMGDDVDNCPTLTNAQQSDEDGDGIGDECDPKPKQAAKKSKKKN